MTPVWIYAVAGLIIGAALTALHFMRLLARAEKRNTELSMQLGAEKAALERAGMELDLRFKATAHEILRQNAEDFLVRAEAKMKESGKDSAHDIEKRQQAIAALVEPIGKALKDMETKVETLGQAGAVLQGSLQSFSDDQRLLRKETQNLTAALRNPAARGRWGEMQLQRTLETIGMVEGTHYTQQAVVTASEGGRLRPDLILMMPGGLRIVIDSKMPVEPYWDAMEQAQSEAAQADALQSFRQNIRLHLKALNSREYWRHFEGSPEFTVMFLPTEGLYSLAVSSDPALLEDAAAMNIILASPMTLMGLLRLAMHGWQQQKMADEARNVALAGAELYKRIGTFGAHMAKLGEGLNGAVATYNKAVGSLERMVLPGVRKLKDMHVQTGGDDIAFLPARDAVAQGPNAAELFNDTESELEKKIA